MRADDYMGPMVFKERMSQVVQGLNWQNMLVYADDIIMISREAIMITSVCKRQFWSDFGNEA